MHAKLKEMIIELDMSEVDFLNAKINIYSPVTAVKQINEYMSYKNSSKKVPNFSINKNLIYPSETHYNLTALKN